uniref:DUF488 domain-containing protein n=1 Tax=Desulfovibrio sp. U5L TaxID=596152 RepID=I2Q6L8_9BACT
MVGIKRVYDPPAKDDGKRYLVDRIWPRGLAKEEAALDGWLKDVAPSAALRKWFNHEPGKWEEFKRRYREELASPQLRPLIKKLREETRQERVTLLFAAKDSARNNALCLRDFLVDG